MRKKGVSVLLLATLLVTGAGMPVKDMTRQSVCAQEVFDESAHGAVVETGECGVRGKNVIYTIYGDGTVYFSGKGKMKLYEYGSTTPSPLTSNRSITSAVFQDGIVSISSGLFYDCTSLSEISVPETVTSIGSEAFEGTRWLSKELESNSLVCINQILVDGKHCSGEIHVPDGVTAISDGAFEGNSSITGLWLPTTLTDIAKEAFYGCAGLMKLTLPENVISVGDYAFAECESLEMLFVENASVQLGVGAFSECTALKSLKLPQGIKSISQELFFGCTQLRTVDLPSGITSIGSEAFKCCDALRQVELPGTVKTIGAGAFADCMKLESVRLLDGVKTIKENAFNYCGALKQITIPSSVTTIHVTAFADCDYERLILYGVAGSKAENYAATYGLNFSTAGMPEYADGNEDEAQKPDGGDDEGQKPDDGKDNSCDEDQKLFPENEPYDETTIVAGDVDKDGVVTMRDAYLTLKAALGMLQFNERAVKAADFDTDGSIKLTDVRAVLQRVLKI